MWDSINKKDFDLLKEIFSKSIFIAATDLILQNLLFNILTLHSSCDVFTTKKAIYL